MAKIGYMRVSKNDQNTDLQRKSLICTNCEQIFEDKISGKTDQRPGLNRALNALKSGAHWWSGSGIDWVAALNI